MNNIKFIIRSFFKKGKYSLTKVLSLSVGLALGLVLIAQVYFIRSYNDFFPDKGRIYQIQSSYETADESGSFGQTAGGVAPGMKMDIPEIEAVTRFTGLNISGEAVLVTPDKEKYYGKIILGDSCLFDVLPLPVLAGDPKEVLARPMYAMVSKEIAEKMGGIGQVIGKQFDIENLPGRLVTIGGIFEDLPDNTHLDYDVIISMSSIGQYMWDGTMNWTGNERYQSYVKLYPGVKPESLRGGIEKVKAKNLPLEELEKAGVSLDWTFKPLKEIHVGDEGTRRMMLIFSILAVALLFTGVMNYVLIVISSLVNRSREMAVNKCYGASDGHIYSRMLLETLFDLLVSVALALLLIFVFRGTILSLLGTEVGSMFTADSLLLLFGVCVIIFFVAALLPGYLYARIPVAVAFRNFSESKRYWKLALLFVQFIAAGFFFTLLVIVGRQYQFMVNDNTGYTPDKLVYAKLEGVDGELRQKALDEVARLPNVESVTSAAQLLFYGASGNNIMLPNDDRELFNIADLYSVGNDYLKIMNIPVVEGRSFTENIPSSRELMVSRSFVDKILGYTHWTDGVVGKSLRVTEHGNGEANLFTICGVYENIRLGIIGNQDTRPTVMFYNARPSVNLIAKLHEETPEAAGAVADVLKSVMPGKDINVYSYSGELINRYSESQKFRDSVIIAGIVTLLICLIGLIGYTNDEMNRRKKETAIRKVNGATIFDIERLFMKDISWMALPAITLGCMTGYFVSQSWLARFNDKAGLPLFLFIACGLIVLLAVLSAVAINCYRAASENPAESIKSE